MNENKKQNQKIEPVSCQSETKTSLCGRKFDGKQKDIQQFTVAFLGDSITYGGCAGKPELRYTALVADALGCKADVYGVIGTRIARQTKPSEYPSFDEDFLMRAKQMKDADFVFVFGGTNDYGHGDADFGDIDSTDEYTFCGAVHNLVDYLSERYGKNNLCFILPLWRFDEDNPHGEDGTQEKIRPSLKRYVSAEEEILKRLGVDFLNLRNIFPVPDGKDPSEFYVDGLHPTDKGHALLAKCILDYIGKKIK